MSDFIAEQEKQGLSSCPADFNERLAAITEAEVRAELAADAPFSLRRAMRLLSPAALAMLEPLARRARDLTLQRFGRAVSLYAPLYVSNYCCNRCLYCGFNSSHSINRLRLTIDEAVEEARLIAEAGFSDLLLVSGDDPAQISVDYLCELTRRLHGMFATLSLEVYTLEQDEYARLFAAGIDGVTIYQETYDQKLYPGFHPAGPKAGFARRLDATEAAAAAGMRQIGVGTLLGLNNWRYEALCVALHAHVIMRRYWQTRVSVSFPRIRPASGVNPEWLHAVSDAELAQMIIAMRLLFPDAGLVLSTREPAYLRDHLTPLGITRLSAGSKTNPGGYGKEKEGEDQWKVADERSPAEVAAMLRSQGYDPVWKDWDGAFRHTAACPSPR